MQFKELINNRNMNDELYLSDITRWLDIDIKKAEEVRKELHKIIEEEDNDP